jgi:hypothetical protein
MTAPVVSWLRHASATNSLGVSISKLSIGKVTAGKFSPWAAISLKVSQKNAKHVKVWLNDSSALCKGVAVSLGVTASRWHFRYTARNLVSDGSALFGNRGTMTKTTLATPYYTGKNSAGLGASMGFGADNVISTGAVHGQVLFLSIRPATTALDGEHTDFNLMAAYDFE